MLFESRLLFDQFEVGLKIIFADVAESSDLDGGFDIAGDNHLSKEHLWHTTLHQQLSRSRDGAVEAQLLGAGLARHDRTSNPISAAISRCCAPRRAASIFPFTICKR